MTCWVCRKKEATPVGWVEATGGMLFDLCDACFDNPLVNDGSLRRLPPETKPIEDLR